MTLVTEFFPKSNPGYLNESKTGMNHAEKAARKQTVNMQAISGEAAVAAIKASGGKSN